jgi:membrane associated rhomboid family serine protease
MGGWFFVNLSSGVGTLGAASTGGVAFFAHIGGFLTGLLAIRPSRWW